MRKCYGLYRRVITSNNKTLKIGHCRLCWGEGRERDRVSKRCVDSLNAFNECECWIQAVFDVVFFCSLLYKWPIIRLWQWDLFTIRKEKRRRNRREKNQMVYDFLFIILRSFAFLGSIHVIDFVLWWLISCGRQIFLSLSGLYTLYLCSPQFGYTLLPLVNNMSKRTQNKSPPNKFKILFIDGQQSCAICQKTDLNRKYKFRKKQREKNQRGINKTKLCKWCDEFYYGGWIFFYFFKGGTSKTATTNFRFIYRTYMYWRHTLKIA